jgi:arsenate reductase
MRELTTESYTLVIVTHNMQQAARVSDYTAFFAESAGTRPAGYVHPMALHVLRELGIALPHARSKSTDEFAGRIFDLALTVCDAAAEECPLWLGARGWAHISFPDPARATGTKAEQLAVFRQVRDDIRRTLIDHLDHWQG